MTDLSFDRKLSGYPLCIFDAVSLPRPTIVPKPKLAEKLFLGKWPSKCPAEQIHPYTFEGFLAISCNPDRS